MTGEEATNRVEKTAEAKHLAANATIANRNNCDPGRCPLSIKVEMGRVFAAR